LVEAGTSWRLSAFIGGSFREKRPILDLGQKLPTY
jgi:hypothetical protein